MPRWLVWLWSETLWLRSSLLTVYQDQVLSRKIHKYLMEIIFVGPPAELLEMFGISATNIVKAVNEIIKM